MPRPERRGALRCRGAPPARAGGRRAGCEGSACPRMPRRRGRGKLTSPEGVATSPLMSPFKDISRRLRGMVQGTPEADAPPPRAFTWEAPLEGSEEPRDPAAASTVETVPLRPAAARPPAAPRARPEESRARPEEPRGRPEELRSP